MVPEEFYSWLELRQKQIRLGIKDDVDEKPNGDDDDDGDSIEDDIVIDSINTDMLRMVSKELSERFCKKRMAKSLTWEDCVRNPHGSPSRIDRVQCSPTCDRHFSMERLHGMISECPNVVELNLTLHQSSYLAQPVDLFRRNNGGGAGTAPPSINHLVIEDVTTDFDIADNVLFSASDAPLPLRVRSVTVEGRSACCQSWRANEPRDTEEPLPAVRMSALSLCANTLEELNLSAVAVAGDRQSMIDVLTGMSKLKSLCISLPPPCDVHAGETGTSVERAFLTGADWVSVIAALPASNLRTLNLVGMFSTTLVDLLNRAMQMVAGASELNERLYALEWGMRSGQAVSGQEQEQEVALLREQMHVTHLAAMTAVARYHAVRDGSVTSLAPFTGCGGSDGAAAAHIQSLTLNPDARIWEGIWAPFTGFGAIAAFRSLRMLDLKRNVMLSDACLIAIASGCPRLRDLYLESCVSVGDQGIAAIAQCCKEMYTLDVRGTCITIDGIAAILDELAQLSFFFVDATWCVAVDAPARRRGWQCFPLSSGATVCYSNIE